jgi:Domain of unknown function (DUF4440)
MKPGRISALAILLAGILMLHAQTRKAATPANPGNREQDAFNAVARLEDQMRVATLKGDASWWDVYLAESYTDVDFRGKVSNKAQTVALHRSSDLSYDIMNLSERSVRTFNGDTAIVTGKMTVEGSYHGQSLSGDYQFTRVWTKSGLDWTLAASQATKIAP